MKKKLIERVTVGSGGAASITFSAIPAGYSDLLLKLSLRNSTAINSMTLRFNGSSSNFTQRELQGEGSGTPSSGARTDSIIRLSVNRSDFTANTFSSTSIYIPNYLASANKSFSVDAVTENNATTSLQTIIAGLWSQTAAITEISFTSPANFVEFSSASLYGIVRGSDGTTTVS